MFECDRCYDEHETEEASWLCCSEIKCTDLDEMIRTEEYQNYASETVYSLQDHCINPSHYDTDADTVDEHNTEGMFGVTHNDVIENERSFVNNHKMHEGLKDKLLKEIDDLHDWHLNNVSLDTII